MAQLITLREAFDSVDVSPHGAAIFLPSDRVWSLETPCAALEVDRYNEIETPPFALQHGLEYVLSVPEVQDIVSNARQQIQSPSADQLLAAFLFYFSRDAFIKFGDRDG